MTTELKLTQMQAPQVPYVMPSERLKMALERAKRCDSASGGWDFLFDELRLARWEQGALERAIRQVQEHLGVARKKTPAFPKGHVPKDPDNEDEQNLDYLNTNGSRISQLDSTGLGNTAERALADAKIEAMQEANRRRQDPEAAARKAKEDEEARARKLVEEEAERRRKQEEEELLKKQKEEEERQRREEEERERKRREEEEEARRRAAEEKRKAEEARQRALDALTLTMELVSNMDLSTPEAARESQERMGAAIREARSKGLSAADLQEAQDLLRSLVRKALAAVLEKVRAVDRTNIDVLKEAKECLSAAVEEAKAGGMTEEELAEAEWLRRKVHNKIEDLKGSIRVFCRIRPLSEKEHDEGDVTRVQVLDSMTLEVQKEVDRSHLRMNANQGPSIELQALKFGFDAVFSPGSQEEIFQDCRDLIQSVFDGYNVTIFGYGQTGAGKTHTLMGRPDAPGLGPQMIREIYDNIEKHGDRFEHQVFASMLELYRNELVDLLDENVKKVNIRTDVDGCVQMENAIDIPCPDAAMLSEVLAQGLAFRTTCATAMNSESSRSHLILSVQIVSTNRATGKQLYGKVQLIDLAGSERLKKSQVTGERQREAIDINKSLTALGDVIEALTQGHKAVPYRNHKLTQVLQDSLGNTAKTLMFVNCSPARSNVEETLASLRYATRAKRVPGPPAAAGATPSTPRGGGEASTPRGLARSKSEVCTGGSPPTPRGGGASPQQSSQPAKRCTTPRQVRASMPRSASMPRVATAGSAKGLKPSVSVSVLSNQSRGPTPARGSRPTQTSVGSQR